MENIPKKVTWIIGPYLIIHTLSLSTLAFITWLAPDFKSFVKFIPFITELSLPDGKFLVFQQTIVAACCAGLGGGVFMIKRFFIEYTDGVIRKNKAQDKTLSTMDIPQYIFLPISSIIIGPISLCLLKAGSIAFEGFSGKGQAPLFTVIALSFIMGLSYYDTLHAFCERSKRIFWKDKNSLEEGKKMKPLSEELIQVNNDIYVAMNKSLIEKDVFASNFTFSYLQNEVQDHEQMIKEFKEGHKEYEWPIDVNGGIIDDYGVVTTIIKVKGDSKKYYHIKLFNRQQSEDWKCVYWRVTKSD